MATISIEDVDTALAGYDGQQVMSLRALISTLLPAQPVFNHIIERCRDPEPKVQAGASWILKNFLEVGALLSPAQTLALIATYPSVMDPDARLNHCQSMRWLTIPREGMQDVGDFIGVCLDDREPAVRAWAYDALFQVTRRDPNQLHTTIAVLEEARDDPVPTVRARVVALLQACRAEMA